MSSNLSKNQLEKYSRQIILTLVNKINVEETDNLPETVRGEGGFGSTGK